jgi:putative copper resistance protein D
LTPDGAAALIRALALAALFQAAGGAAFAGYFGARLGPAAPAVQNLVQCAAVAAAVLIGLHGCVETARLSGDFAGAWDRELQTVFWTSHGGFVHLLQMGALALIALCIRGRTWLPRILGACAALAATAAIAGSGHTSIHPLRVVLAPLLVMHVTVGACWFGSLGPLVFMTRRETTAHASSVLHRFSRLAGYAVPILGVAGVAIACELIPRLGDLVQPYGLMLTMKAVLFAALLVLASYNRWKHVPALMAGSPTAAAALRRSIGWEIALIAAVLAATAIMTTYFSPSTVV